MKLTTIAAAAALAGLLGVPTFAAPLRFTPFDYPGGSATDAFGINNDGTVVGVHSESTAYLRDGQGNFTEVSVPGSTFSELNGVNNAGIAAGDYSDAAGFSHSFIRKADGTLALLPDIIANPVLSFAFDVNDAGNTIVGVYTGDSTFNTWQAYSYSGFDANYAGGVYATFTYPGALRTQFNRINDQGQIVGRFADAGGVNHGFLIDGAQITVIDFPGADATNAFGLNNLGDIVGYYRLGADTHGFLLSGGIYSTVDFPGAAETRLYDINDFGQMVGVSDERGIIAQIPEPSTIGLFAVALGILRRRRVKSLTRGLSCSIVFPNSSRRRCRYRAV